MSNDKGKSSKFDYGRRFLYAEDLLQNGKWLTPVLKIETVFEPNTMTAENKTRINKWAVKFEKSEKILVLANCNTQILHLVTGQQPGNGWIGKTIKIGVRVVSAFGDNVLAIRVIPPKGTMIRKRLKELIGKAPDPFAAVDSDPDDEMNQEVPFDHNQEAPDDVRQESPDEINQDPDSSPSALKLAKFVEDLQSAQEPNDAWEILEMFKMETADKTLLKAAESAYQNRLKEIEVE